jgi:FKBP-type peptidyl-prolyl cis-trans isomerase (trigger factor)
MTIETATPSSAETIAALFDTLVDAVAARVLAQLDDNFNARLERFAEEELDEKIDEWAANFLDDRVKEHVSEDDLHDQVLEIVQNLDFDIKVSR